MLENVVIYKIILLILIFILYYFVLFVVIVVYDWFIVGIEPIVIDVILQPICDD